MLKYQWDEVSIPYWKEAVKAADEHKVKVGFEMHPGMLVYNVETMLRLREAVGPTLGCNFDPSHFCWNGVDTRGGYPQAGRRHCPRARQGRYVDPMNVVVNGCNDNKPYSQIAKRAWTFRSIGYGHDTKVWKDIVSVLCLVGYDYVISIEHEDPLMSQDEGLAKGIALLKEACIVEKPGAMFWARCVVRIPYSVRRIEKSLHHGYETRNGFTQYAIRNTKFLPYQENQQWLKNQPPSRD